MPLRADSVAFAYLPQRPVLRDISVTLPPASTTAILGPNGAGKSTLLRLLLGLLDPTSGSLSLDDRPLRDWSRHELASRLAYVPQRPDVAFSFNVEAVVAMGRYSQDRAADAAAIQRALTTMDIADRSSDPFATLSAGQQQRVAIARALAQLDSASSKPRVLLADEPVSAMDPRHALHAMRALRDLQSANIAIAVVLHDFTLAARFCDHTILLSDDGRLIASGPTRAVLTRDALRQAFHVDFADVQDPAFDSTSKLWFALPDRI